jgi:hypothetical protein
LTGGGFIVDHTALAALGRGNRFMSRLVVDAASESDVYVFAPALCLAAATAERPALADHIGSLRAVEIVDLGFPSAAAVGHLLAEGGADWRIAHAIDAARPTVDWPGGRPVVTAEPDAYAKWDVATIALHN